MSSLFKKRNRKFRHRETRSNSEDEKDADDLYENKSKPLYNEGKALAVNENVKCSSNAIKEIKNECSQPKINKLLSFHDDDEEEDTEVFKLRKSNHSRRLAKQREKERKQREFEAAKIGQKEDNADVQTSSKESKQKAGNSVYAGIDAEDMEVDSNDEENEKEKNNQFKNLLQSGVIPDAATIYAMKKHRQMAREMGDFIPVDDPETEGGKSRLIREDDNDRSDDDDEPSRINFTVNTGAVERQKIRETFLSLQEDTGADLEKEDAAELELWEREQIKKGVGVTQVSSIDCSQVLTSQVFDTPSDASYHSNSHTLNSTAYFPPSELLNITESSMTTEDIKARIQERLSALKNSHESHLTEVDECRKELIAASEEVEKLKEEAPKRSENFSLYQQMSGYVHDLVECFDVKLAHIDLLDGRIINLYKNRAQKLAARRQRDVQDQSEEFSAISSEILKGINVEYLSEKHTSDEAKLRRIAEREGRKMRRRKQREQTSIINKHQDGFSSDDEEPDIDIIEFKKAREIILREADTIFEDVVEDFGTLEGVMNNFENWKSIQLTSYCEAFVPLCLPKIFSTFVKLSLLDWNPLKEERDFEKMSWFHKLICYGLKYEKSDASGDPDTHLVPCIIERVVVPKIIAYIQNVWSPVSKNETTMMVNLIRKLNDNYYTVNGKSKQFQNCVKAINARIEKALDDDIFIPLYPKELLENRSLGASDYFHRQFWFSLKFLQNIVMFEGVISEQPLQYLAIVRLLNRYLLMGLHTSIVLKDTLEKCKAIVNCLPKSWFQNLNSGSTLPLLNQFVTFLNKYASSLYSSASKKSVSDDEVKDIIKEIVQLLAVTNSLDDAVTMAKKYSVSAYKNS